MQFKNQLHSYLYTLDFGLTPLMYAAGSNEDPEVTVLLLRKGADVNMADYESGSTPLMWAAGHNPNPDVTAVLLDAGADINAKNDFNLTPLMCARSYNENPEVASLLMEKLANVNAKGRIYPTPQVEEPSEVQTVLQAFRRLAEQGHAKAQFDLGVMYAIGQGVSKNDTEAVKWFRKAAEQRYAMAQHNLGVMYAKGDGVPIDYEEAYMWVYIAVTNGCQEGQETLTLIEGKAPYQVISIAKQRAREFLAKQGQ